MRAEIGNEYLVVCLSEYLPIYVIKEPEGFDRLYREEIFFGFQMWFRPTCCPRGKGRSNNEINRYVYAP